MSTLVPDLHGLHIITVTRVPDEHNDDIELTVDHCSGNGCTVWNQCTVLCVGYQPTANEADDCRHENHGTVHNLIDGFWMTESTACALTGTDSGMDGVNSAAEAAGLGTHRVSVDYWGDGIWEVALVPGETKQGAAA